MASPMSMPIAFSITRTEMHLGDDADQAEDRGRDEPLDSLPPEA